MTLSAGGADARGSVQNLAAPADSGDTQHFASLMIQPLFLHILLFLVASACNAAAGERPNIVFILADDLGWSDTTLFGTTEFFRTPNIERLAS
jgi:hypothetical protein